MEETQTLIEVPATVAVLSKEYSINRKAFYQYINKKVFIPHYLEGRIFLYRSQINAAFKTRIKKPGSKYNPSLDYQFCNTYPLFDLR